MDGRIITRVDMTSDGALVTFADGYTFLFPSHFLYRVRLKEGQLVTDAASSSEVGVSFNVNDPDL
jgi:hypothetical protein